MATPINERSLILLLAELHRLTEKHCHSGLSRLAAEVAKELRQMQCKHEHCSVEASSGPYGPYEVKTCKECGFIDVKKLHEYGS